MQNLKRNEAIATAVIKGATLESAARKFDLSIEQIRRIVFSMMRAGSIKRYGSTTMVDNKSLKRIRHNVRWSLTLIRNL